MKNFKRAIALLLMVIFMMQPVAFAASVADFLDFPHDWSTEAMTAAVENGLYLGNNNKLIRPNGELTRAELAAFITRAFGATREADISQFTDVNAEDWHSAPIAKAYQMGAMSGTTETTFAPEAHITREEVFLALARVLCISGTDESVLDAFSDKADISDWSKNAIIGLVADGYIKGDPNGTFRPKDNITRAELAQLFHNIFGAYIDDPGYHTSVPATGSVMVRVPGVRLENVTINGDLVIADGVGVGNFDLTSVTVNGRILARGGEGKVTFKSVNPTDGVTIFDPNGVVNFNNYRTDAPFKNLNEITKATFLTKQPETTTPGGSTSGGGRPSATYYTVRYYVDGELWESRSVRSGSTAANLTAPEKVGHTSYWATTPNGDTAFDFDTKITGARSLYAVYKPIAYEVAIKDADGNVVETQTVNYGEKLDPVPAIPEAPEGKYFDYWLVNGEEVKNLADHVITGKTEIVPHFSNRVSYKVTLIVDGTRTEIAVYEGDKLERPNDPEKEGWDFKHWSLTENGSEAFDFNTPITAETTLYAVFEQQSFTVRFLVEGNAIASETVKWGEKVAAVPENPTKDGYNFAGWKVGDTIIANAAEYVIKADTDFVAKFTEKNVWTITFADNSALTQNVIEGEKVQKPEDPTKPGHTFNHWSKTEGGEAYDFDAPVTESFTLYPVFTPNTYTVTFYDENGALLATKNVVYDNYVEAPTAPAVTGKTFSHWSLTKGGELVFDPAANKITDNTALYAVYTLNNYTYTIEINGNSEEHTVPYGTMIDLPSDVLADEGYQFVGWLVNGAGNPISGQYCITENVTFVAKFDPIAVVRHTVTFDTQDGMPVPAPQKVESGKFATKPADPAKEGYKFLYWSLSKTGEAFDFTTAITSNITLYAVYEINTYTVTFESAGKTESRTVEHGKTVSADGITAGEQYGYEFAYWYLTDEAAEFDFTTAIIENITLHAKYNKVKFTVTFMANGEEYATADVLYEEAIGDGMPADPTLADNTFVGWFTEPDGEGEPVDAATVVMGDMTAYAHFAPLTKVTVTFYSPLFEDESIASFDLIAGETLSTDDIPALRKNNGYYKNGTLAPVYAGIDYTHTIENEWWTLDENGKWTLFDVNAPVYKDTDVYENYKNASLIVTAPTISASFSLVLEAPYRKDVRVIDTLKDALFTNEPTIKTAIESADDRIWEIAVEKGILDSETEKNILNQHRFVKLVTVIGKQNIEKYIWEFVSDTVNESEELKQYIRDHLAAINDGNKDQVIRALDVAFNKILESDNADNFRENFEPIVADVLLDRELFLETLIRYVDSKVDTTAGKNEIKQLMTEALDAFAASNADSLKAFIKEYTVKQVEAGNQVFIDAVADYIFENIGDYIDNLNGYISNPANVSDEQFKDIILTVADGNFDIVSNEIHARMVNDLDFAKTVFGNMLDSGNETFKALLKSKIPGSEFFSDAELKEALDAYLATATADELAELADAAIDVLDDDAALRNATISAYLDKILGSSEEKNALIDKLGALIVGSDDLKNDPTVKPVIDAAIALMIENLDEYENIINSFVKSLVDSGNFNLIINAFVESDKAVRDDALTEWVGILDDATVRMIAEKIMDKMFEAGKLDEALVSGMVDYLAKPGNENRLNEIVEMVIANVDGSMLAAIAAELGHDGTSSQVTAINELIRELSEEEQVTVNAENVFMFEPILDMLKKYDFAFIKSKIPAKALPVLPMEDIERLYNRYYNGYVDELEAAMAAAVANPGTDYYAGSGVQIDLNPISDLFAPALDYIREMKMFAEDKVSTSDRFKEYYDKYYKYYENNPYIDALEEFLTVDKWVTGSDNGYLAEKSGYALRDFDSYYANLKALIVIIDDAMSWYYDEANVPAEDREAVFAIAEHKVIVAMNIIRNYIVEYATNGIPSDLKSFIASIESDPTLLAYLNRFGVIKYLEKIEDNALADKVFDTVYEKYQAKLEARVEALLEKFVNSTLNRVYDEEDYEKMKNLLMHLFTTDTDELYNVDSIFDIFFGGADAKQVEYGENTVTVSRSMMVPEDEI